MELRAFRENELNRAAYWEKKTRPGSFCGTCGREMIFDTKLKLWVCPGCHQMGGNCFCDPLEPVEAGGLTDE